MSGSVGCENVGKVDGAGIALVLPGSVEPPLPSAPTGGMKNVEPEGNGLRPDPMLLAAEPMLKAGEDEATCANAMPALSQITAVMIRGRICTLLSLGLTAIWDRQRASEMFSCHVPMRETNSEVSAPSACFTRLAIVGVPLLLPRCHLLRHVMGGAHDPREFVLIIANDPEAQRFGARSPGTIEAATTTEPANGEARHQLRLGL